MEKVKLYFLITLMPFLSGIIVAANLERLVPNHSTDPGHWWKVGLSMFLAFAIFPIFAWDKRKAD